MAPSPQLCRITAAGFSRWRFPAGDNTTIHSGSAPGLDRKWVRFLPPNEANDEMFFVEEERHVRADNTFFFKSLRWEAPRHLPDRTIHIRFQRSQPARRVVVYYKGERMGEARLLDAVANDRRPLTPPSTINSQPSTQP